MLGIIAPVGRQAIVDVYNPTDLLRVFFHGWQCVVKGRKEGEHGDRKSNRESDKREVLEAKEFETQRIDKSENVLLSVLVHAWKRVGAILLIFHGTDMKGVAMLRQATHRK